MPYLKKREIFLLAAGTVASVVILIFIMVIASNPKEVYVSEGEEFQLRIGETARVRPSYISIFFKEVVEDSRCPKGVNCVWEGRAIVALDITISGKDYAVIINNVKSIEINDYTFRLVDLEPYPGANPSSDNLEYIAHIIAFRPTNESTDGITKKNIPFTELSQASGYSDMGGPVSIVVNSQEDMLPAFKSETRGVDFSNSTVIFVAMGLQNTGGYSIAVERITQTDGGVTILVTRASPGPNCAVTQAFTNPFHLVVTQKLSGSINFQFSDTILEC